MATQNVLHGQGTWTYLSLSDGFEIDCLVRDEFEEQTEDFKAWLDRLEPFRYSPSSASLDDITVRPELRNDKPYWYAFKRTHGRLYKQYVGQKEDIRPYRLDVVAGYLNHPETRPVSTRKAAQKSERLTNASLQSAKAQVLADDYVTRHGKDRGAVRRGLEAFIARLQDYLD